MNSNNENQINHNVQEMSQKTNATIDKRTDKGDIDDYIFSWQTIKTVSER